MQMTQRRLAHSGPYKGNTPQTMISGSRTRMLRTNPLRLHFQQTTLVITRWLRHASPARFHQPLLPLPQTWAPTSLLSLPGFLHRPRFPRERLYLRPPALFRCPRWIAHHPPRAPLLNVRPQQRGPPFFHRPVRYPSLLRTFRMRRCNDVNPRQGERHSHHLPVRSRHRLSLEKDHSLFPRPLLRPHLASATLNKNPGIPGRPKRRLKFEMSP
jgi:hypothetical protein